MPGLFIALGIILAVAVIVVIIGSLIAKKNKQLKVEYSFRAIAPDNKKETANV